MQAPPTEKRKEGLIKLPINGTKKFETDRRTSKVRELHKKIEELAIQNRELSSQLLLVQEEERQKLADNIHECLGQSLTLLVMQVNRLRKVLPREIGPFLDEIETQTREVAQQARDLSASLSMNPLKDLGLSQALRDYFEKVQESTSLKVNFRYQGPDIQEARIVGISVFRIAQEAITNVLRHARTDEVDISIEVSNEVLSLRIEDRGTGFVPDSNKLNSAGMRGMRERAEVLGAKWTVESSPGKGTLLTGEFPLYH